MRGRVVALIAGIALAAFPVMATASAEAAEFRYWSYWTGGAAGWTFASQGPAFRAADESVVEGWRLAVSDVQGTFAPRIDAATLHDRACRDIPPESGRLRIAVVVDFGTRSDALAGDVPPSMLIGCAVVDDGATGFDALRSVGELRTESGMVCGIDGYPSAGCGRDAVDRPDDQPAASTSPAAQDRVPSEQTPSTLPGPSPQPEPMRAGGATRSATPAPERGTETPTAATAGAAASDTSSVAVSLANEAAVSGGPAEDVASGSTASASASASGDPQPDDSASGGPLVAGLVLVGLVLLTAMGWLRARNRR